MAIDYYKNLTHEERLDRIGRLLAKGVYLYSQKKKYEPQEPSDEKKEPHLIKSKYRRSVNLTSAINLEEKVLTIEEAVDFLRISRTTLWRIRKRGGLPCCNLSNRLIRFKLSEMISFINSKSLLRNV